MHRSSDFRRWRNVNPEIGGIHSSHLIASARRELVDAQIYPIFEAVNHALVRIYDMIAEAS